MNLVYFEYRILSNSQILFSQNIFVKYPVTLIDPRLEPLYRLTELVLPVHWAKERQVLHVQVRLNHQVTVMKQLTMWKHNGHFFSKYLAHFFHQAGHVLLHGVF